MPPPKPTPNSLPETLPDLPNPHINPSTLSMDTVCQTVLISVAQNIPTLRTLAASSTNPEMYQQALQEYEDGTLSPETILYMSGRPATGPYSLGGVRPTSNEWSVTNDDAETSVEDYQHLLISAFSILSILSTDSELTSGTRLTTLTSALTALAIYSAHHQWNVVRDYLAVTRETALPFHERTSRMVAWELIYPRTRFRPRHIAHALLGRTHPDREIPPDQIFDLAAATGDITPLVALSLLAAPVRRRRQDTEQSTASSISVPTATTEDPDTEQTNAQ